MHHRHRLEANGPLHTPIAPAAAKADLLFCRLFALLLLYFIRLLAGSLFSFVPVLNGEVERIVRNL